MESFLILEPPVGGLATTQQILLVGWAAEEARRRRASVAGAPGEGGRWCRDAVRQPLALLRHDVTAPSCPARQLGRCAASPPGCGAGWSYHFFPSNYFPVSPFPGSKLNLCTVKALLWGTDSPEAKGPCGC